MQYVPSPAQAAKRVGKCVSSPTALARQAPALASGLLRLGVKRFDSQALLGCAI